ncbi:hypothetical protein AQ862_06605 [Burkholderia pseudomallei]|nr:hypothetical protein AQ862_06605 [Burkholderia pseudomallei]
MLQVEHEILAVVVFAARLIATIDAAHVELPIQALFGIRFGRIKVRQPVGAVLFGSHGWSSEKRARMRAVVVRFRHGSQRA